MKVSKSAGAITATGSGVTWSPRAVASSTGTMHSKQPDGSFIKGEDIKGLMYRLENLPPTFVHVIFRISIGGRLCTRLRWGLGEGTRRSRDIEKCSGSFTFTRSVREKWTMWEVL